MEKALVLPGHRRKGVQAASLAKSSLCSSLVPRRSLAGRVPGNKASCGPCVMSYVMHMHTRKRYHVNLLIGKCRF